MENNKTTKILKYIAYGILAIQFLFLIYANFNLIPETLDNDVAKLYLHIIKMWEHKTLFVPGWNDTTTLELDCASLIALPVYGITKNIYASYATANVIFAVIFIVISWSLMKYMNISDTGCALGCALIITPLSFGQLLYYNMMFFAGGQYVIKALVPLLLIWILVTDMNSKKVLWCVAAVSAVILIFINGMSSAAFVLAVGVLPLTAAYIWFVMLRNDKFSAWISDRKLWFLVVMFMSGCAGVLVSHYKHTCSSGSEFALVGVKDIFNSFENWVVGMIENLGGMPDSKISALSPLGAMYFLRFMFCIVLFGVVISVIVKVFRTADEISDEKSLTEALTVILVLWNSVILIAGDMGLNCRYMLICAVPAFLLFPGWLEGTAGHLKACKSRSILTQYCVVFVLAVMVFISNYSVIIGNCAPEKVNEVSQLNELLKIIQQRSEKTIVFYDYCGGTEIYRLFDYGSDREYQSIYEDEIEQTYGWYKNSDDYELPDEYLFAFNVCRHEFEEVPAEIRNNLELVDSYQIWKLYRYDGSRR